MKSERVKIINAVLLVSILNPSVSYAIIGKDQPENEIAAQYKIFKGHQIPGLKQQPCREVQFVYSLQEKLHQTNDKNIAQMITAIIKDGTGVGGISKRQATEDERKILIGSLYTAIDNGAIISSPQLGSSSSNSHIYKHQQIVSNLFEAKKASNFKLQSYNFIKDENSYKSLIQNLIGYKNFMDNDNESVKKIKSQKNEKWIVSKIELFSKNSKNIDKNSLRKKIETIIDSGNQNIVDDTSDLFQSITAHKNLKNKNLFTVDLIEKIYIEQSQKVQGCLTQFLRYLDNLITPFETEDLVKPLLQELFKKENIQLPKYMDQYLKTYNRPLQQLRNIENFEIIINNINPIALLIFILNLSFNELDEFGTQILRFSSSNESILTRQTKIMCLARMARENREAFIDFVLNNHVDGYDIHELSQVGAADWADTLRGIRDRALVNAPHQIQGIRNQTVHDSAYETSIKESAVKLGNRYRSQVLEDLATIRMFFESKIDDLLTKNLLTSGEARVAHHFFTSGFERLANGGNEQKIKQYLNLAWQALNDQSVALQLGSTTDFTDKDIDDRFAGWLKAGPIDAQLAYKLDNLGGQYKDKVALLKAVETNGRLITDGQSCVGGSFNRLIDALNLIHPDVQLAVGESNRQNIELMARNKFLLNAALEILQKRYAEEPEAFEDLEALKKSTAETLKKIFQEEVNKNHKGRAPNSIENELKSYFDISFEETVKQTTPLKPVKAYLGEDWGLRADLEKWLEQNKDSILMSEVTQAGDNQTETLVKAKLKVIKPEPSSKAQNDVIEEAKNFGRSVFSNYRKEIYKELLTIKLQDKSFKNAIGKKKTQSDQIQYVKDNLTKYFKTKGQNFTPSDNDIRTVLAEREIRELLDTE